MKKYLLLLAVVLPGCSLVNQADPTNTPVCNNDVTHVESYQETWSNITYSLPWCWIVASSIDEQLILRDQDSDNTIEISTFKLNIVEGPMVEIIKESPVDTVLYVYVTDPADVDIKLVLDSL